MIFAALILAIGLFIMCLKLSGVLPRVRIVIDESRNAVSLIASRDLSEDQKEAAIKDAAVRMFSLFFSILIRVTLTVGCPIAFIILGSASGLYTPEEAMSAASNIYFIIISTIVMVGALVFVR